jgi:hypothetical protein
MTVFFAMTRSAFESYMQLAQAHSALWVSAGVLSAQELASLRAQGMAITDFNHSIDPGDPAAVQDALDTIQEHHPEQVVWIGR